MPPAAVIVRSEEYWKTSCAPSSLQPSSEAPGFRQSVKAKIRVSKAVPALSVDSSKSPSESGVKTSSSSRMAPVEQEPVKLSASPLVSPS